MAVKLGIEPTEWPVIAERFQRGESTAAIGASLGVSHQKISRVLRRMGIKTRSPREAIHLHLDGPGGPAWRKMWPGLVARLRAKGYDPRDIRAMMGLSYDQYSRALLRAPTPR